MCFFKWNSELSFREIKTKIKERKKAAPENAENKWMYFRLWRLLLIHYLGPVVVDEESHGQPILAMHHFLMIGFCFSYAGKTRMLGLTFYDYVFETIILTITFLGPYLYYGSLIPSILTSLPFILLLGYISYREINDLTYYERVSLGFDPK